MGTGALGSGTLHRSAPLVLAVLVGLHAAPWSQIDPLVILLVVSHLQLVGLSARSGSRTSGIARFARRHHEAASPARQSAVVSCVPPYSSCESVDPNPDHFLLSRAPRHTPRGLLAAGEIRDTALESPIPVLVLVCSTRSRRLIVTMLRPRSRSCSCSPCSHLAQSSVAAAFTSRAISHLVAAFSSRAVIIIAIASSSRAFAYLVAAFSSRTAIHHQCHVPISRGKSSIPVACTSRASDPSQ